MLNSRNRKFEDKDYLQFLRQLPCLVSGKSGDNIHPHHVDNKGIGGQAFNDFMAVPLIYFHHITNRGHVTFKQLEDKLCEDPKELIIFCLSMYIKYLKGEYDLEADRENHFIEFRRKLEGVI